MELIKEYILEAINTYANDNLDWNESTVKQTDYEVYMDGELIAIINFCVYVDVIYFPLFSNYENPPESGECNFILESIEVTMLLNSKDKDCVNAKKRMNYLLTENLNEKL